MALNTRPAVYDLFSGAGLLSKAFALEGFAVTRAIESDPIAAETAQVNLKTIVEVADLRKIKPTGKCDVLVAGPPCQGFSTLGKRNPHDPRNSLSLIVPLWAKELEPLAVVVENVASFLTSPVSRLLAQQLRQQGYRVSQHVFDAVDFGVPQRRKRCFVVASRTGDVEITPLSEKFASTVAEAWNGLATKPDNQNWHSAPEPSALALARMKVIPRGGDRRDVMRVAPNLTPPSWWRLKSQVTDSWGRLRWHQPSNTLRTCLQNASKGRYIHPEEHRVISLREAARLHSIDDGWRFCGYPIHISRQIGNSVPLWLGRAVARGVMRSLL